MESKLVPGSVTLTIRLLMNSPQFC